ncbi:MAG TPA: hypothetical protein VGV18_09020 [Verrucomicrobiae bacterium]|nr:hypothetical protein [Verrucomicrobiae bacterium]
MDVGGGFHFMNSGVLQFSLGLATGGFARPLAGAMDHLKGFIATAIGFGAVIEGVKGAIERGTNLEHLHQQTGESVKDLYELQEAFKAVGVDSSQLPMMLLRMQQAMSGLGRGANNAPLFGRVGLDIQALKRMDAPAQIDAIAQALSRVDKQTATGVVAQLFGIETGAVPFLQVIGSAKEFHEILSKVASDALEYERASRAFAHFDANLVLLHSHVSALFAGLAEGIIPTLDILAEKLDKLNSSGFGRNVGRVVNAIAQAVASGRLSELIGLSLQTGVEMGVAGALPAFEKLGFYLLSAFKTPLEFLQAGLTYVEEKLLEWVVDIEGKLPAPVRKALGFNEGMRDFKADSFQSIFSDEVKRGLQFNVGTGDFGLEDINKDAARQWKDAKGKMKRIAQPLLDMINGLAGLAEADHPGLKGKGGQSQFGLSRYQPQFTSFEKMGFVMGGNPIFDLARRTADNTFRTADGVQRLVNLLGGPAGAGGAMTNEV